MVISAKAYVNPPSFIIRSFAQQYEINQQGSIVSSYLAGRFLVRLRSGSGRTYTSRMGRRPAFFCPDASRTLFSEVAMLTSVGSHSQLLSSAGRSFVRRTLAYSQAQYDLQPQDCSTVPRGIGLTTQTIGNLSCSPPSVSLNGIHERYLSSAKERSSSN